MKTWLHRNRIKLFLGLFLAFCIYGFYLSAKSEETKEIVKQGVLEKDAQINTLVQQKQAAKTEEIKAKKQIEIVKQKVADSTAVVLQQKQQVIDSLTQKMPHETPVAETDADADAGNPDAVLRYLSTYKPKTVPLADGDSIY
jgi:hypothetical protein